MKPQEKFNEIFSILDKKYNAEIKLNFTNPLELLIATILAAQCTDERVNKVTESLFEKYPDVKSYANANLEILMQDIKSTGFYKNKAKNIKNAAKEIIEKHNGKVPDTMRELTELSGVGRKTANVVLGNCFNKPAIIVDTHFKRLMNRIGLSNEKNPDKIEKDVIDISPEKNRTRFSNLITTHGREVCKARKPRCEKCIISHLCDYYKDL